jgi:uncharacterized repeat protein (TIGR03803 family)
MKSRGIGITLIAATLFALGAQMASSQESVIYSFAYGGSDGLNPYSGLISDGAGNLYGTTSSGGAIGSPFGTNGAVFELTPGAGGTWTEKVLYSFGATTNDGIVPLAGLILDAKGNLYGTTSAGGANGDGAVFELSQSTGGTWTEKVLYSFGATSTDASGPKRGSLIFDAAGNLYGTTRFGGPNQVSNGGGSGSAGTVFELTPGTGGSWTEKVLYSFGATASDGANPTGGVIFDAAGNLYGTTLYGGTDTSVAGGSGTVFELTPATGGTWKEKILHSFKHNGTDGVNPYAGVVFDAKGNLYGTTAVGGSGSDGTVFELSLNLGSGVWTEKVLHNFSDAPDGNAPYGSLILDGAGDVYGMTSAGGANSVGSVFQLKAGTWTENLLYSFINAESDGQSPQAGPFFDAAGNLYGTTSTGGTNSFGFDGTVFEIASVITGTPVFSVPSGAYSAGQTVTLTDPTAGATIYFSINGGAATKYTTPIAVSGSEVIQAYATGPLPESQLATASYQIGSIAAAPYFLPRAGTYALPLAVTLIDAAPGATIYYTTNGTTPTTSSSKYAGPIVVSAAETIEAFAVAAGYANSPVASAKYSAAIAATPTFSPAAGTYTLPQPVTLTDSTTGATIYYTTDGTTPTTSSTKYTGAITVSVPETIKAIAAATGYSNSVVGSATYTGTGIAPQISPATGTYALPQPVTLTDAISGATIYYTTNGTTPTTSSTKYTSPITVSVPETIEAFAVATGYTNSSVASATYMGTGIAPQFSPPAGIYASTQSVTLTAAAGATIYYTTNGSIPTTSSSVYSKPITVSAIETIEAFAVVTGYSNSPVASGSYVITSQEKIPTVIYNFKGSPDDVSNSLSGSSLAQGRDGNIYGSMQSGGNNSDGGIFVIEPSGTERLVYSFNDATDGDLCGGGVILGTDGNLYGDCWATGGSNETGSIYKATPAGALSILANMPWPSGPPLQATDGNFYGTFGGLPASVYKLTPSGTLTTLSADPYGDFSGGLLQGSDGSLYGTNQFSGDGCGGIGCGSIFKITLAGQTTLLHTFTGTDGAEPLSSLIQGTDGNFYGTTYVGGANGQGVVYKMTPSGTLTVLHNFSSATDGAAPQGGFVQATDGNFYGIAFWGGIPGGFQSSGYGSIFKVTPAGVFTTLYLFDGTTVGGNPIALIQHTNGLLYGDTYSSGTSSYGAFYSLDIGAKPFVSLVSTSGKVGSKIGILGQGFSASSVVKFNGVTATTVTRSGTTFLLATVPAGASNGKVTVTTGASTLTSNKTFIVHNSWGNGAVMPTAVEFPAAGLVGSKIYVVGGVTSIALVGDNQVYTPATNTWTMAAAIPTPVFGPASAVVNGIFYVIGGYVTTSGPATGIVQAYNPTTNTWSTKTSMPTARGSAAAVVDGGMIYVIGGNGATNRLTTVEKFNPATDTWTTEAPLLVGKSEPSAGLLGTTIVAAGGYTASGDTGDNEGYTVATNKWSALTLDATPRNASCSGALVGQLYVAGGAGTSTDLTLTESFNVTTNKWTAQAAMPQAVVAPGSAVDSGLLYCFGGSSTGVALEGSVYNNVQIYQP